jgi:hypothetical protein
MVRGIPDTVQAICVVSTHKEDYFWNLRFSFLSRKKNFLEMGKNPRKTSKSFAQCPV